jgi:deoxyribose-phosphate aldolase
MILTEHIDHACIKPDTTIGDVEKLCREAVAYRLKYICLPPLFVKTAKTLTAETGIQVAAFIGFPYGFSAIEAKLAEIVLAIIDGADEIEMVINAGAVKNNDWQFLANEINTIIPVIRNKSKKITIILETALMTDQEIITACDIYGAAGADFVKTGTGTMENGMILEQVKLIRNHLAEQVQIKATVKIKNQGFALDLFAAGANRLCCSNSLKLLHEALQQN